MKLFIVFVVVAAGVGVFACRRGGQTASHENGAAAPSPNSPRVTIWVTKDGVLELDAKSATPEAVGAALAALAQRKGVVLYGRDAPSEEPHPNGMKVIEMVVSNRLPIRMCTKHDFSDAIGPDGKLLL